MEDPNRLLNSFIKEIKTISFYDFEKILTDSLYYFEKEEFDNKKITDSLFLFNWKKEEIEYWIRNLKENKKIVDNKWVNILNDLWVTEFIPSGFSRKQELPFYFILKPLSFFLLNRIKKKHSNINDKQLENSILNSFIKRINPMFYNPIITEFNSYYKQKLQNIFIYHDKIEEHDYYKEFSIIFLENINKLFITYPILARLFSQEIIRYENFIDLFFKRFTNDKDELSLLFEKKISIFDIQAIDTELSDIHNKGETAILVSLKDNLKLIYKPRSVINEYNFNEFMKYLNERVSTPITKSLKIINKKEYGWVEFISWKPNNSIQIIKKFYFNMGRHMAIFYLLNVTDMHYENMIAHKEFPVFIDYETIFTACVLKKIDSVNKFFLQSILSMCFIRSNNDFYNNQNELACLHTNPLEKDNSFLKIIKSKKVNNDSKYKHLVQKILNAYHLPFYLENIDSHFHKYYQEVILGFLEMYNFFLKMTKKERISLINKFFSGSISRLIIRATNDYSFMRDDPFHYLYVSDPLLYSSHFENIWKRETIIKMPREIVRKEIEELMKYNIPYFTFYWKGKYVKHNKKIIVKKYFYETVYSLVKQKLNKMSFSNMCSQINIFYSQLFTVVSNKNIYPIFQNITNIKEQPFVQKEFSSWQKYTIKNFINFYSKKRQIPFVMIIDYRKNILGFSDIYTDRAGSYYFFLMLVLYKKNRNNSKYYNVFIEEAFQKLENYRKNEKSSLFKHVLGFYEGIGLAILIYSLKLSSMSENKLSYKLKVKALVRKAMFDEEKKKKPNNIMQGLAGFVFSLLFYRELVGDNSFDDLILQYCEQIKNAGYLYQKDTKNNLSFLFGEIGVAFLFYCVGSILKQEDFLQHAKDIINSKYQDTKYLIDIKNSLNMRFVMLEILFFSLFDSNISLSLSKNLSSFFNKFINNSFLDNNSKQYLCFIINKKNRDDIAGNYLKNYLKDDYTSDKHYLYAHNLLSSMIASVVL
jgi:type 2 lantibiotic biosynthesis protein LanM